MMPQGRGLRRRSTRFNSRWVTSRAAPLTGVRGSPRVRLQNIERDVLDVNVTRPLVVELRLRRDRLPPHPFSTGADPHFREHVDLGILDFDGEKRPFVLIPRQIDRRAAVVPAVPTASDEPLHLCARSCACGDPIAKRRVSRQPRNESSGGHSLDLANPRIVVGRKVRPPRHLGVAVLRSSNLRRQERQVTRFDEFGRPEAVDHAEEKGGLSPQPSFGRSHGDPEDHASPRTKLGLRRDTERNVLVAPSALAGVVGAPGDSRCPAPTSFRARPGSVCCRCESRAD